MKCIIGLGNPGRGYKKNRHNIGFMALDAFAGTYSCKISKRKFKSRYGIHTLNGDHLLLAKPHTYMNLSGTSVRSFVNYFKCDIQDDLLVLVDDVNLSFGGIRFRTNSSAGGHNGLQSVIDQLGTKHFARMRIGVGQPPSHMDLKSYVLSNFTAAEMKCLPEILETACSGMRTWLEYGVSEAMQRYN